MGAAAPMRFPALRPFNLKTGQYGPVYVGLSPQEAVIAAYAQEHGDYNTWEYFDKYKVLVERGKLTITCGDWTL